MTYVLFNTAISKNGWERNALMSPDMSASKKSFMLLLPVVAFLANSLYPLDVQLPHRIVISFAGFVLSILSVILYIRHVQKNSQLAESDSTAWVVGFIVGINIVQIVYWFLHVNKKKA